MLPPAFPDEETEVQERGNYMLKTSQLERVQQWGSDPGVPNSQTAVMSPMPFGLGDLVLSLGKGPGCGAWT